MSWGKQAELVERYADKGNEIAICGKLTSRPEKTQSGEQPFVTEILYNEILFLGGGEASGN